MEYDDYYHPTHESNLLRNIMAEVKALDKGYHKIRWTVVSNNGKKNITVELYSSGDMGSNIRDAITGKYYTHKVGSLAEDAFFTVRIATGDIGYTRKFFFSSPGEYENIFHITLNEQTKKVWNTRQHKLMFQRGALPPPPHSDN